MLEGDGFERFVAQEKTNAGSVGWLAISRGVNLHGNNDHDDDDDVADRGPLCG